MKVTTAKTQERKLKVGYHAHSKKKWTGKTNFAPKILLAGNLNRLFMGRLFLLFA